MKCLVRMFRSILTTPCSGHSTAREKKAKIYSWQAFVFGEIVAEIPYLLLCAFLYWVCWYPVVGFSFAPNVAGPVYLQMTLYEFLYTGIGERRTESGDTGIGD